MIRPVLSSIAGSCKRSHIVQIARRIVAPASSWRFSTALSGIACAFALVAVLSAGLAAFASAARDNAIAPAAVQKNGNSSDDKQKSVVETGCLIRRDKPGDFALTTRDAKLFYVESSTVDLAAHVGHTVTLTGTFAPDSETRNDPDKAPEAQTIKVTKLEMVSKTCH